MAAEEPGQCLSAQRPSRTVPWPLLQVSTIWGRFKKHLIFDFMDYLNNAKFRNTFNPLMVKNVGSSNNSPGQGHLLSQLAISVVVQQCPKAQLLQDRKQELQITLLRWLGLVRITMSRICPSLPATRTTGSVTNLMVNHHCFLPQGHWKERGISRARSSGFI